MEQKFEDKRVIQYLLGQLSAQEQEQFEERYFTDDLFFENFLAVKEELIDLYARGELTGHQLERFEKHFLTSPRRQQRVEDTRRLIAALSQELRAEAVTPLSTTVKHESVGWWQALTATLRFDSRPIQFSLAALALAALVFGAWWWMTRTRHAPIVTEQQPTPVPSLQPTTPLNVQVNPTPQSTPQREPEQDGTIKQTLPSPAPSTEQVVRRPSPVNRPAFTPPPAPAASLASITLTPVLTRDTNDAPALIINPGTETVRVQLVFKSGDYRSCQAVVRTVEGNEIRSLRGLKARVSKSGSRVTFELPAELLTRRDYLVTLSGVKASGSVEEIGEYYLQVERSPPQP